MQIRVLDVKRLAWQAESAAKRAACPLCGGLDGHAAVVVLPGLAADGSDLTAHRCGQCASVFFQPAGILGYETLGDVDNIYWRHYIEVGAGLFEMSWPVACLQGLDGASLLDVGCGFGFTLDFWQRIRQGVAVGAETATYGAMGSAMLGVKIHAAYLQDIPELAGQKFSVICASEVIEHVPHPHEFVSELAKYLADDGVLVLTTPDASFVQQTSDPSVLLAAVSPGFHAFLFSASRMEAVLQQAGFSHVIVESTGERLIAWASRQPIQRSLDFAALRADYCRYLNALLLDLPSDGALFGGIAYRLFKESVNAGDWSTATDTLHLLEAYLWRQWGIANQDGTRLIADAQQASDLDSLGARYPFFLPVFFYYRAMFAMLIEKDARKAAQLWGVAFELGVSWSRLGSAFQLETLSHIWTARMQQIHALLACEEDDAALQMLEEMLLARGQCVPQWGYAIAAPELVEATLRRAHTDSVNRGRLATAERCLVLITRL